MSSVHIHIHTWHTSYPHVKMFWANRLIITNFLIFLDHIVAPHKNDCELFFWRLSDSKWMNNFSVISIHRNNHYGLVEKSAFIQLTITEEGSNSTFVHLAAYALLWIALYCMHQLVVTCFEEKIKSYEDVASLDLCNYFDVFDIVLFGSKAEKMKRKRKFRSIDIIWPRGITGHFIVLINSSI